MISGMLWFDNDPKTGLAKKIDRAAQYYQKKYGQPANLCFVHPKMLGKEQIEAADVEVKTSETILLHHLWIGTRQVE